MHTKHALEALSQGRETRVPIGRGRLLSEFLAGDELTIDEFQGGVFVGRE
jgi:hypothetical protein